MRHRGINLEKGDIVLLERFDTFDSELIEVIVTYVGTSNFRVENEKGQFSIDTGLMEKKQPVFNRRIWFSRMDYEAADGESQIRARLAAKRQTIHLLPIEKVEMILNIIGA